jgi:biopolymer transport protein ExbD
MRSVRLFLVLTSTFTEQTDLQVSLPSASSGESSIEQASVLRVLIDADGRTYIDDRPRPQTRFGPGSALSTIEAARASSSRPIAGPVTAVSCRCSFSCARPASAA